MQLVSKIFNLCGHDLVDLPVPTLQTDRRTDRQTICDSKTALCTIAHHMVKMASSTSLYFKGKVYKLTQDSMTLIMVSSML